MRAAQLDSTRPYSVMVIPAYAPDSRLPDLVDALCRAAPRLAVVVVDDGSGPGYRGVFDEIERLGHSVLRYSINQGKGQALKYGFREAERLFPGRAVVCADADGQHSVDSILRVANLLESSDADMVLGVRQFGGQVPLRSRFGNVVTCRLFQLSTGHRVSDTQTGLRGYPARILPWLVNVPGERYEYEFTLLLKAVEQGLQIDEIAIETIYLDHNASSHFRTIADSVRVYTPLLKFSASSLAAFGIDTVALFILSAVTGNLLESVLGARLISSVFNFTTNRHLVFHRTNGESLRSSAAKYFALATVIVVANFAVINLLNHWLGVSLLVAKIVTEIAMFIASFVVQRLVVFRTIGRRQPGPRHLVGPGSTANGYR